MRAARRYLTPPPSASVKSLLLGIALLLAGQLSAEPYTFLEARASEGDGMYTLLRRHGLPLNSCYQDQFRHLNELPPEHTLHTGKSYRLPVLVYAYDGKSIRSTLGIDDLPLARRIQAYNRGRERAGQHTAAYEETRELWVPYGLLFCESEEGGSVVASGFDEAPAAPAEAASDRFV